MTANENFLPKFRLPETQAKPRNKLRCQVRGYDVPAIPEERVRQRVLHWLLNHKRWTKLRLEKAYRWESDVNKSHIRTDIELLDETENNVVVVVECKHEEVPLSKAVEDQAVEYAIKSKAKHIWITNGEEHKFLDLGKNGRWKAVRSIAPIGEQYDPPTGLIAYPNRLASGDVAQYLDKVDLKPLNDPAMGQEREFTLALYKVIFSALEKKLPYTYDGVHLLEYLGVAFHQFSNRSGGVYFMRYADFVAATRGRVEAMSVAISMWGDQSIRLCVGVSKANRKHHALQLDFAKNCEWNDKRRCWDVYHDGAMSQVKSEVVLEAVREAGCGHWIYQYDDKEWVYLGELPGVQSATWKKSRKFLANLLHYCIIRTNLREARKP